MIYLVTGGSGSGKSAYAEEKLCSLGNYNRIYFATMEVSDKEGRKKVERHRKLREGKAFTTIEQGKNLKEIKIPKNSLVLLECMSNLLANEMYAPGGAGEDSVSEILEGVWNLDRQAKALVVVSNEVFGFAGIKRDGAVFVLSWGNQCRHCKAGGGGDGGCIRDSGICKEHSSRTKTHGINPSIINLS